MDLRLANGYVPASQYQSLTLSGSCELGTGASFNTATVSGALTAHGCSGKCLTCESGNITCHGDMRVATISGHGRLEVRGNLICDSITFTGDIHVYGQIICSHALNVYGRLTNNHTIRAEEISIDGVLIGQDLHIQTLQLQPLRSLLLSRIGMRKYLSRSRARTVIGTTINARKFDCDDLHARHINIGEHCRITHICSRNIYHDDGTSRILKLDAGCTIEDTL